MSATLGFPEYLSNQGPGFVLASALFLFFCFFRTRVRWVYDPRIAIGPDCFTTSPDSLPAGFFAWIPCVLGLSLDTVAETAGCEAAGYVLFQLMMCVLLGIFSVICCVVLIPIFATGGNGGEDFEAISIANLPQDSPKTVSSALVLWAVSPLFYLVIFKALQRMMSLRLAEDQRPRTLRWHYTVLAEDIPPKHRNTRDIREHLDTICPGQVRDVQLVKNLGTHYEEYVAQYIKAWCTLDHLEKQHGKAEQSGKANKLSFLSRKDEVSHLRSVCSDLRSKIEARRLQYNFLPAQSCAFVTLESLEACVHAVSHSGVVTWVVRPAPDPRCIIWPSLMKCHTEVVSSALLLTVWSIVGVVIIFFAIPTAFCAALGNLEALADGSPWLGWVLHIPAPALTLIQGVLPVVALHVLNAMVVPFFGKMFSLSGSKDYVTLARRVMISLFMFFFCNSFLICMLSNSLFNSLNAMAKDPSAIRELLGKSIPASGTFFLNFVSLAGITAAVGRSALLEKLVFGLFRLRYLARTLHDKEEAMAPDAAPFEEMYAIDVFFFMLVISYVTVSPVLLPAGCIYFAANLLTGKYLVTYVYTSPGETGGQLMVLATRLAMLCMAMAQLSITCLHYLKGGFAWMFCLPLPCITFTLFLWSPRLTKPICSDGMPLDLATQLDEELQRREALPGVASLTLEEEARCARDDMDPEEQAAARLQGVATDTVTCPKPGPSRLEDDGRAGQLGGWPLDEGKPSSNPMPDDVVLELGETPPYVVDVRDAGAVVGAPCVSDADMQGSDAKAYAGKRGWWKPPSLTVDLDNPLEDIFSVS